MLNLYNIPGEPSVKENIRHEVKTCKTRLEVKLEKEAEALIPGGMLLWGSGPAA